MDAPRTHAQVAAAYLRHIADEIESKQADILHLRMRCGERETTKPEDHFRSFLPTNERWVVMHFKYPEKTE